MKNSYLDLNQLFSAFRSTYKVIGQMTETMTARVRALVFWQLALLTIILCLCVESFVFNSRFWIFSEEKYPKVELSLPQASESNNGMQVDINNAQVTVNNLDLRLKTVKLVTASEHEQTLSVVVNIRDVSSFYQLQPANSFLINPGGKYNSRLFYLDPRGKVKQLQLAFQPPFSPLTITKLILNEPPEFNFSILRFVLLSSLLILLLSICYFKLYRLNVVFEESRLYKYSSRCGLAVVLLLSFGYFLLTSPLYTNPISYDLLGEVNIELTSPRHELLKPLPETLEELQRCDEYVQQLSALRHGSVAMEFPWDPKLNTLKNPFDRSERAQAGVKEYFDMVVYKNKYYMPHGLTPILIMYLPVYLLTGKVPVPALACFLCAVPALLALYFAMQVMLRSLVVRGNLIIALGAQLAILCCSGVFLAQATIAHYALSTLCGMTFLALWCTAVYSLPLCKSRRSLYLMLVIAGFCILFLSQSRQHLILLALTLGCPFLWLFFKERFKSGKADFFRCLACLGIPIALGVLLYMGWNYARFNNPMGFSAAKVMSLTDQKYLPETSIAHLMAAWWYFLFEPVNWSREFPFVLPPQQFYIDLGRVFYISKRLSLFAMPVMWGLFLILFFKSSTSKNVLDKSAAANHYLCGGNTFAVAALMTILGLLFIVSILIYASGINCRYTLDLTVAAGLISFVLIALNLRWEDAMQSRILYCLAIFLIIKSIFIGLMLPFGFDEYSLFRIANPDGYIGLSRLFQPFSY